MKITKKELLHLATLARIRFTDGELDQIGEHLGNMLGSFELLNKYDTSEVEPTAHILDAVNVLREDEAKPSMDREELLKNAPESDGSAYITPRVLE